jgi:hypothetical protein
MTECYCDYEPATVYIKRQRKARKRHRCYECRRWIEPGETYENLFAVWDGDAKTVKTCSHCVAFVEYIDAHVPCFCYAHGNIIEDGLETLREYAHECPGLWAGGVRLYVAAKRIGQEQRRIGA